MKEGMDKWIVMDNERGGGVANWPSCINRRDKVYTVWRKTFCWPVGLVLYRGLFPGGSGNEVGEPLWPITMSHQPPPFILYIFPSHKMPGHYCEHPTVCRNAPYYEYFPEWLLIHGATVVHISNSIQSLSHRPFQSVMHINFIYILCWGGGGGGWWCIKRIVSRALYFF